MPKNVDIRTSYNQTSKEKKFITKTDQNHTVPIEVFYSTLHKEGEGKRSSTKHLNNKKQRTTLLFFVTS